MAAVFLVTLYEYSPVFYISVVSLCFVITAAIVLGWFGIGVPVILRSSDETESILPTPEKQMVQVTNPFALQLGFGPTSVADGVSLKACCLEPCILNCFWGCEVSALQRGLQAHQYDPRSSSIQHLKEILHLSSHHFQCFHITSEDEEEHHTQIPADRRITDYGPLPRSRYPLVGMLTLERPEAIDTNNIVASVTVIHVPDEKYTLSARILFQYLLTSQGNMYELKPLFMSTDSGPADSEQDTQPWEANHEASRERQSAALEEEEGEQDDWSEGKARDCVVCQNAAVNRVLLPCRHTCVCDSCVSHFQYCPICRAFIMESFTLTQGSAVQQ
ncbi:uncharacterized protein V6R79_000021 [Siganus canaliculatus]